MLNIFPQQNSWQTGLGLIICLLLFIVNSSFAQNRPGNRQSRDTRYNTLATGFSPDGKILAISRGTGDYGQRYGQIDLWDVETGKLKRIIKGFDGPVWSVSFSADGQTLISGSSEFRYTTLQGDLRKGKFFTEIKWWDVVTGDLKFKQTNPTDEQRTLVTTTSADGKLLANAEYYTEISSYIPSILDASSSDATIRPSNYPNYSTRTSRVDLNLLNAQTGAVSLELKGILKSNLSTFRGIPNLFTGPAGLSGGVVFSPSGNLIAVGMSEEVKIWDTRTGANILKLKKFKGKVRALTFSPDEKILGIASVNTDSKRSNDTLTYIFTSELNFYDVSTGKLIKQLKYNGNVSYLSFLRLSRGLLIGVTEYEENQTFNLVKNLSLETGKITEVVNKQRNARSFILSPNEQTIAFMNGRSRVSVWDLRTQRTKFNFDEIRDEESNQNTASRYVLDVKRVLAVGFSADGKTLAAGTEEKEIKLWDPRTGALKQKLTGSESGVSAIALSADGRHLISSDEEAVRLWNIQTGMPEGVFENELGSAGGPISLSPDGKTIVSGNENSLLVWNAQTKTLQKTLDSLTPSPIISIIFSSNGQNLITANENGLIQVWDLKTDKVIKSWEISNKLTTINLSPNGQILASATNDGLIGIWDVQTGSLIKNLDKHDGAVNSLAFSPDGRWMASGGDDRKIFVWDTTNWKSEHTMKGLDLTVTSLAFSPDGEFLASGSGNMSVVLWNVETGKLERILK